LAASSAKTGPQMIELRACNFPGCIVLYESPIDTKLGVLPHIPGCGSLIARELPRYLKTLFSQRLKSPPSDASRNLANYRCNKQPHWHADEEEEKHLKQINRFFDTPQHSLYNIHR
jgi:hypothetical protein